MSKIILELGINYSRGLLLFLRWEPRLTADFYSIRHKEVHHIKALGCVMNICLISRIVSLHFSRHLPKFLEKCESCCLGAGIWGYGKTRVTICKWRFTSYELKFKSASSSPLVSSSNPRVTSTTLRVEISNPRFMSSNPRVQESFNQWKPK